MCHIREKEPDGILRVKPQEAEACRVSGLADYLDAIFEEKHDKIVQGSSGLIQRGCVELSMGGVRKRSGILAESRFQELLLDQSAYLTCVMFRTDVP
ncbi:hypothetical protein TWF718_003837 [Orbilia javanica]|uniref:Uncharacterized protein n=1 Tax=Orbilia javanica TaxID=47235 RepID=A0AAN8REJ9_9PEZI